MLCERTIRDYSATIDWIGIWYISYNDTRKVSQSNRIVRINGHESYLLSLSTITIRMFPDRPPACSVFIVMIHTNRTNTLAFVYIVHFFQHIKVHHIHLVNKQILYTHRRTLAGCGYVCSTCRPAPRWKSPQQKWRQNPWSAGSVLTWTLASSLTNERNANPFFVWWRSAALNFGVTRTDRNMGWFTWTEVAFRDESREYFVGGFGMVGKRMNEAAEIRCVLSDANSHSVWVSHGLNVNKIEAGNGWWWQ